MQTNLHAALLALALGSAWAAPLTNQIAPIAVTLAGSTKIHIAGTLSVTIDAGMRDPVRADHPHAVAPRKVMKARPLPVARALSQHKARSSHLS